MIGIAGPGRLAPPLAAPPHATVLLAEDQPLLRDLFGEVLEDGGFAVLSAASGEEALEAAARHRGTIDLVVTDVLMPGMSGPELVARLRETRPNLKALYLTGESHDAVARAGLAGGGAAVLHKPFETLALDRRVRELLGAPGA